MANLNKEYFKKNKNNDYKSAKLEDFIKKDEEILWRGIPKKLSYAISSSIHLLPFAVIWLIIDISAITSVLRSSVNTFNFFVLFFFILFHLFPVWIFIGMFISGYRKMKGVSYAITNKRIIYFKAGNQYIFKEIPLNELVNVHLKRSFVDKCSKVGDIKIVGLTKSIIYYDVFDSEFLASRIRDLIANKESVISGYEDYVSCEHCGSYIEKTAVKCPNCGASRKSK